MTSTLRRKHPTTAPASPTTAATAISRAGLLAVGGLLLTALAAPAQTLPSSPYGQKAPAAFDPLAKGVAVKPMPAPAPAAPVIQRAVLQQLQPAAPMGRGGDSEAASPQIQFNPPGPERLFRLENEAQWKERMRQEALERTPSEPIVFPEEPILTTESYAPRVFPPLSETVEPGYVTFKRLYFEQKNFERGGWDLGFVGPFVAAGTFFFDVATLPYHMGTQPLRHYDTGAGQCLPGDPVPFLLYPPELSLTGAMAEAGVIVTLYALFPAP